MTFMPITQSAKKALRQSIKRNRVNRRAKDKVKKAIKEFKAKPTKEGLKKAFSKIDQAIKKNLTHKNKAARLKSQLAKLLSQKPVQPKKSPSRKAAKKNSPRAKIKKKK